MNRKSMAKIGAASVVIVLIFILLILLFLPLSSSSLVEENYTLGEKVKINLRGYGSYVLKIATPTTSFIKNGINDIVLFTPDESGIYRMSLQYGRQTENYTFEVIGNETEQAQEEVQEILGQLTHEEIIAGQPIRWTKRQNIAPGTRRTKIALPMESENISTFRADARGREPVNFSIVNEEGKMQKSVVLNEVYGDIEVEYYTKGPEKRERTEGRKKEVQIFYDEAYSLQDVEAETEVEELSKLSKGIKVYWKEENRYIDFQALDLNGNGYIDTVRWIVPHLSNQTFEIIVISQAEHLNATREFVEDVYTFVSQKDNLWKSIPHGDYLRVMFEKNLTAGNDITLYARGNGRVEVYEKDGNEKLMEFNISGENWYKGIFSSLESQDTFDLLVFGNIEFDYIVDPSSGGLSAGGLRPQTLTCYAFGAPTTCDGLYPRACGAGLDLLSCNENIREESDTDSAGPAGVDATYYNDTMTDCVRVTNVKICYEWWSSRSDPNNCEISIDNDVPNTFVEVISACSGTTPGASDCYDVTQNETDWQCSNFFGASGTRAMARAFQLSPNTRDTTVYIDQLWYNVTYQKAGNLNSTLNVPSTTEIANNQTIYQTFTVNASVKCLGSTGDGCGNVSGTLRYNSTSAEPNALISTTPGATPFFASIGAQSCGDMNATAGQDYCELIWTVNATQLGKWKIDVNFSSAYSNVYMNDTKNANISVYNPPTLTVNLTNPAASAVINQSESLIMNCTANCSGQTCENVIVYPIYCQGAGCTPNKALTTVSVNLSVNVDSVNLGTLNPNTAQDAGFNISSSNYGNYVLSCNATSSNDGNPDSPTTRALSVNSLPNASFTYPLNATWLHETENLDGSASSDIDGTIAEYLFEIDDNSAFTSSTIICQGAEASCSLNTSSQTQCSQESNACYLRLRVIDNYGGRNSTIIRMGIDNVAPTLQLDRPFNNSFIATESQIVNATASDLGSGVNCVQFSAYYNSAWTIINTDCSSPYSYDWSLASVSDQVIQVRARANDSEGNWGKYANNTNITHDTSIPIAILDSPLDNEIINKTTYLLNASSSYNGVSGVRNATFYYENSTDFKEIGSDTDGSDGLTYNWNINIGDGVYNISVNVTNNAGLVNSTKNKNITIDIINTAPVCTIIYPNGYENVSGVILVNATASDSDPSDYIANVTFQYSSNGGASWNAIGVNLSSGKASYVYSWNTSLVSDSNNYTIRCNASDTRMSFGSDVSNNNFTVDNTPPGISSVAVNSTYIPTNAYVCFNASVQDNFVGVQSVRAEINYPESIGGSYNLTLYDSGTNCDASAGDRVYSNKFLVLFDGEYNWTKTYANDTLGNLNATTAGINFSGYSNSYLISEMLFPVSNIEINEAGSGSSYYQNCNVTCNASGGPCNDVYITAEYFYSGLWTDILTSGNNLFNEVNNYSCGNLASGAGCNYTFNISANYSGGNTFGIRCHGASSNAAADFSSSVDLYVNEFPVANFTYPLNGSWLHGTEMIDVGASYDDDGSLINYLIQLDNNTDFDSPKNLCDGVSTICGFITTNPLIQTRCLEGSTSCYLKLTVTDDDGTTNSTVIQIGIDNVAPTLQLDRPFNNSFITTESQIVNATASDLGSGVNCVVFSAYYNSAWTIINTDCSSPYSYDWSLVSVSDQVIQVRARANDSEGNWGKYANNTNITHDATKPSIQLFYPLNNSYLNSTTLTFNFTATDSLAVILNCSLIIDSSINQTNSSTKNGSLTLFTVSNLGEGSHNWSVNCTDYVGNENSSEMRKITLGTTAPVVNLNYPANNQWLNNSNVTFNYTPIGTYIDSCELWGNWTGTWGKNDTDITITNGSVNSFNKIIPDGSYLWNIKCNDSAGNYAFNASDFTINIHGVAPLISFNPSSSASGIRGFSWIFINVTASDTYKDSVRLGWTSNETFDNSEGDIYWENKTGLADGSYSFYAWINDSAGNYNETAIRTIIVDRTAPNYTLQNQTVAGIYTTIVHRDKTVNLSAFWGDAVNLSTAWLSTNESGVWENKSAYNSPQSLSGTTGTSEFSWSNSSVPVGTLVSWSIYANDSVNNKNLTNAMTFRIWGWAEVWSSYFSPAGVKQGEFATLYCMVRDNVSQSGISGYSVSFFRNGVPLGSNTTAADGYVIYTVNETAAGSYTYRCEIGNDAAKYYNASSNYYKENVLGVGYALSVYDYNDLTYNRAYEGTTATTTTPVNDYPALQSNSNDFEDFTTSGTSGLYAYQRFEIKINESLNQIKELNVTWSGYGDVNSGTDGFNISVYNFSSNTWVQQAVYTTNNSERLVYFGFDRDFSDIVNSTGYVWILARSYSAAPTPSPKTATIATDYIGINVKKDIIPPDVVLIQPVDYYNSSIKATTFNCSVSDDYRVENVSLYGNWSGSGHLNETNTSGLNNKNYSFNKSIEEGTFVWNCYSCDRAGNCAFASLNRTFTIDQTGPEVNLMYPGNYYNLSSYSIIFNFSVNDNTSISNCSLYGNWTTGWHLNQTVLNPSENVQTSFSSTNVSHDGYFIWNVLCYDIVGNKAFNSSNLTFSSFLFPDYAIYVNATQDSNKGDGNITLFWNASNHTIKYYVYSSSSLAGTFTLLNVTLNPNYTDTTFSGTRKFYRIDSWNPVGQNASTNYFGAHVYTLRHTSTKTRNWIGFPTDFVNLDTANQTLYEIRNATTFSMWNETNQKRVSCTKYSCPNSFECTDELCNFNLEKGRGYEVDINLSQASPVLWSQAGIVYNKTTITLSTNSTSFSKNWAAMYSGTLITNALGFIVNLTNEYPTVNKTVTNWNSATQKSEGYFVSPLPPVPYLGTNFNVIPEGGYEVSVTSQRQWAQG